VATADLNPVAQIDSSRREQTPWARVEAVLDRSPSLPLLVLALGVFVWQAAAQGGFPETVSSPGAIILLALLIVGLVALPTPRLDRTRLLAIGLIAGYVAWSYLSILWAGQQSLAWQGSNRTLMYAVAFALFALWPIDERDGGLLASIYALGIGAIGLYVAIRMGATHGYREFFFQGRLDEPVGYTNADVALWTGGAWVALIFAGRRFVPAVMRGLLLGAAVMLVGLAVLGQSRGWFVVLPLMLILMVVLVPGRGRTVGAIAIAGIGIAAIIEPLLDVYRGTGSLSSAATALLIATAVLALIGVGWALLDGRESDPGRGFLAPALRRRLGIALVALFILAGIGGVAAFTAVKGNPITRASDAWNEFREGGTEPKNTGNQVRLGELGGTFRYDYWSVAWHQFLDHPVAGIGVDNFGRQYLIHGSSYQTPTYPHSIELRTLAETGLIGLLLLGGGVAAACVAARRRMRRCGVAGATTAAACLVGFAYFIIHGSIDWLWEYPALGAPALALLGLATTVGTVPKPAVATAASPDRVRRIAIGAVGAVAVLVIAASMVFPWLSERQVDSARALASTDPTAALKELHRASSLNPLATLPDEIAGVILGEVGQAGEAEAKFHEVLEREPGDPFAFLQLGVLASSQGHRDKAEALLGRARELNPRDKVTAIAQHRLRAGKRLQPAFVNALLRSNIYERTGLH
jgi:O-Antigen ligase/Tetratricopeptide repeat